ncbi:MAG: hypothetical protein R8K48_07650 [Gallionella sp.]
MLKFIVKTGFLSLAMMSATTAQAAVDSYRFAHVTIATPWYIFLFLLMGIFVPFVLMAVLSWRFAMKKTNGETADTKHSVK